MPEEVESSQLPAGVFEVLISGVRIAVYRVWGTGIKMEVEGSAPFLVDNASVSAALAIAEAYRVGYSRGHSFGVRSIREQIIKALGI